MSSAILACERTTHPLLLHCLQDLDHDWRRLQLVNTAMAAAFRLHKNEVEKHTAKREQLRQDCAIMSLELAAFRNPAWRLSPHPYDVWAPRCISDPSNLARLMAQFEEIIWQLPSRTTPAALSAATIEPVVFSVHHIYANHIFDAAFMRSSPIFDLFSRHLHD